MKIFKAIKPMIIQEYKQKMLRQKMAMKNQRQLCIFFIIYITFYSVLKKSAKNFEIKRNFRHMQLRRIWCAIITKVKMMAKLKKRGNFEERHRSLIKQCNTVWYMTLRRPHHKRIV